MISIVNNIHCVTSQFTCRPAGRCRRGECTYISHGFWVKKIAPSYTIAVINIGFKSGNFAGLRFAVYLRSYLLFHNTKIPKKCCQLLYYTVSEKHWSYGPWVCTPLTPFPPAKKSCGCPWAWKLVCWDLNHGCKTFLRFYHAVHYSAKHGLAIACRPSVTLVENLGN